MVSPRIWVSWVVGDDARQGMALAQRLISDLRDAGAEVVSASATLPDEQFLSVLQQELASCQWFLLVQTPQGMGSRRAQLAIQEALSCLKRGSLRGACLVSALSDGWDESAPGPEMKAYTYNGDYPRLRDKLLLDLDLLQITGLLEEEREDTTVGMRPPIQRTPGFPPQAAGESAERPASFQERSGEIYKAPSFFRLSSPFGSLRQMGSMGLHSMQERLEEMNGTFHLQSRIGQGTHIKDIRLEELVDIVRKAADGEAILHPHIAARLIQEVRETKRKVSPFVLRLPSLPGNKG